MSRLLASSSGAGLHTALSRMGEGSGEGDQMASFHHRSRRRHSRTSTAASTLFTACIGPFIFGFCLSFSLPASAAELPTVVIGAKKFTEGAILAELMAQVLEQHAGARVTRQLNLAGTKVAFEALRVGGIDAYAEYTGTGLRDILGDTSAVHGA